MLIRTRLAWLLSALVASILAFVPLFSLLGYESSAAMGVVLGLLSMWLTTWEFTGGRLPGPLDPARPHSPAHDWVRRLLPRLAMSVPPLLILLLNMVRVRNCDPATGLLFWLVIPCASVVLGHTLGFAAAAVARTPRRAVALGLAIAGAEVLWFVGRLIFEPPIQGYLWFAGWFAGSIYDEALSLPAGLLWHRLTLLMSAAAVVMLIEARWRVKSRREPAPWAAGLAVLMVPVGLLWWHQETFGIHLDTDDIQERLGGELTTEHFTVWYDPGALKAAQVAELEEDLEFRYTELGAFFDEDPVAWKGRRIEVYLYPDRQTQNRLFGSRGTFVARPWTHAMHLRWDEYGDSSLAHELAHLFTAPFGGGPLKLATRDGVLVHIGLVEGIALAADWPPQEQDPHETAAGLRALGKAPDVRVLFEPEGFWSQPGGKAYTLMGSFVRWIVDEHGIEPFKEVYKNGHWQDVYGQSPDELVTAWEQWVDTIEVPPADLEHVRHKHRRGSIFERPCARTLAELQRKAGHARARGDLEKALELRRTIKSHKKGDNDDDGLEVARLLADMYRHQEALDVLDSLLSRTGRRVLKPTLAAQVRELRGDILWRKGERAQAAEEYSRCLGSDPGDSSERRLIYKQLAADSEDAWVADRGRDYFLDEHGRAGMLYLAIQWSEHDPTDPLARYLVGFQLRAADECAAAIPWLVGPPGLVDHGAIDEQRRRHLAMCALRTGELELAESTWLTLRTAESRRLQMQADEYLERIAWKRQRDGSTGR